MATPTTNPTQETLLQLADEYRHQGYEIFFLPNTEDLPDFLKHYRPDMIARRGNEAVVIEVESRSSLNSSGHYLQNLARSVEQHPGWRFELVMTNPQDVEYFSKAGGSLQQTEIEAGLKVGKQLAPQHPESAILYVCSLLEATLRLMAEQEGLSLKSPELLYLVKQLAVGGIISSSEYRYVCDVIALRDTIAHGFKASPVDEEFLCRLIGLVEQFLHITQTTIDR